MPRDPGNPRLRRLLLEIVENQLRDGTPPETAETLARLIGMGYSRERAVELIACVVSSEIFNLVKQKRLYDEPGTSRRSNACHVCPGTMNRSEVTRATDHRK